MKVRKLFPAIAFAVSAVILLVSASYAWILNNKIKTYESIFVDYVDENNHLTITSGDIKVEFWIYDPAVGDYVYNEDGMITLNGIVPNETIRFKLLLYNNSGASRNIAINMIDIQTDDERLSDETILNDESLSEEEKEKKLLENSIYGKLYVGLSAGEGYRHSTYPDIVIPDEVFYLFSADSAASRAGDGMRELNLYSRVVVPPPTKEYDHVELQGYFWLDKTADLSDSNITVTIEHLRILM